jgi:hypothetical protein
MAPQDVIPRPAAGAYEASGAAIQRSGFGERSVEQRHETQGSALAARAQAEIQSRYVMAMQRPRSIADVRQRLLDHCARRGFAEIAEYAKPVGGKVMVGPSIRFVESALQEYGNVWPDTQVVYDDDVKRVVRVSVTDLERNVSYSEEIVVEKFVERRNAKGGEVLGTRTNSTGEVVFKVRATDDDLANKQASAQSKRIRNLGLRILPADIVAEAMARCRDTRSAKDAADPAAALRAVADAFASIGVMPRSLEDYLGHPLGETGRAELDELRVAYATVRDGDARWHDLVEAKRGERGETDEPTKAAGDAAAKVRERLSKRQRMPVTRPDEGVRTPPDDVEVES